MKMIWFTVFEKERKSADKFQLERASKKVNETVLPISWKKLRMSWIDFEKILIVKINDILMGIVSSMKAAYHTMFRLVG